MSWNTYVVPELVHAAFIEGDEAAWSDSPPPAWAALNSVRECDQWRALRVRNRRYASLGQLVLRSNDPAVQEELIGVVSAQRKFQYRYSAVPVDAASVGVIASQFGFHMVIHFSNAPVFDPLNRSQIINHPGFRRVIRYLNEERPYEGPILDTCYTAGGGPNEPTVFNDTPPDRSAALLEQLAALPRPVDPLQITEILLRDCLDLTIWPVPEEHDKITGSTPAAVIRNMSILHQSGLLIPTA